MCIRRGGTDVLDSLTSWCHHPRSHDDPWHRMAEKSPLPSILENVRDAAVGFGRRFPPDHRLSCHRLGQGHVQPDGLVNGRDTAVSAVVRFQLFSEDDNEPFARGAVRDERALG